MLSEAFRARFGRPPQRCFRAPGRINLIGEHTDYNAGWVMPAAIDLEVTVAAAPREERVIRLYSEHFDATAEFLLDAGGVDAAVPAWSRSLRGVALLLDRKRRMNGADLLLRSRVPVGAGLSSSAAAEVAVGCALAQLAGIEITPTELALVCQQASHEFAGSRCGIMDQYIACMSHGDAFAELDTQTLGVRWLPWPANACLMAVDTGVRHDHASGEYNRRREECEEAAARLGLATLRELGEEQLPRAQAKLPPLLYARCRHVIEENARVHAAAAALLADDLVELGRLLNASHASLRDDYQVSCPELDLLAEICRRQPGVWGARMMGGGFGGCVLVLLQPAAAAQLPGLVAPAYRQGSGHETQSWLCRSAAAAGSLEPCHA
ncbi:MAG TPA: galactokinase [Terriglobales bacterium]|nr:galactokinase [Terriglobales bacterium]